MEQQQQTEVESVAALPKRVSLRSKFAVLMVCIFVLCVSGLIWVTYAPGKVTEAEKSIEPDNTISEMSSSSQKDQVTINNQTAPQSVSDHSDVPDIVITNVTTAVNSIYVFVFTEHEINYKDYNYLIVDTRTKTLVPISGVVGDIGGVAPAMIMTKVKATAASSWEIVIYRDTTEIERRPVTILPDDRIPVVLESVVISSDNASSSRIATVGDTITLKATFSKPISGVSFTYNTLVDDFSQKISDKLYQSTFKVATSSYDGKFSFDLYNIAGFSSEQVMNKNGSDITMVRETTDKSQVIIFGTGNVSPDDEDGYVAKNEYARLSLKDQPGYDEDFSNRDIGCDARCQAFFQGWIDGYEEFDRQCGGAWEGRCVTYENFFDACSEEFWTVDMSFLDECTTTADCNQKWRTYFTSCKANWKGDYRNYRSL